MKYSIATFDGQWRDDQDGIERAGGAFELRLRPSASEK